MLACPIVVHHWPQFQTAAEKGKGVTEAGARAKKAAEEIKALWSFLDRHAGAGRMECPRRSCHRPSRRKPARRYGRPRSHEQERQAQAGSRRHCRFIAPMEPRQDPAAGRHSARTVRSSSRKNRRSVTTWQDEAALKELRTIANETGISQQALIAEGLNYVLTKYRKRTVAT